MKKEKKIIDKTSALICNEKDACMRCARICHFLYSKCRPFSDYPGKVAMMVKGKIYMGDINQSKIFAAEFSEQLAAKSRKEIKVMFDEVLSQTGIRQPVKIVADKDTTKHRQAVCVTSKFPLAEETDGQIDR